MVTAHVVTRPGVLRAGVYQIAQRSSARAYTAALTQQKTALPANSFSLGLNANLSGSCAFMSYLGINSTPHGLRTARTRKSVQCALAWQLSRLPATAPVTILIHGYQFDPGLRTHDPHRLLFAFTPVRNCWKIRSWTAGLGFAREADSRGLCIGFAWPAHQPNMKSLLSCGRSGFARVYDRATEHGEALALLISLIHLLAPGRAVNIVAHSLGARVALSSLRHLSHGPDRMILLGAAEYVSQAENFLSSTRLSGSPMIYNFTARSNDAYDALFELCAPRRRSTGSALGSGMAPNTPNWLDIQLDCTNVTDWVNRQGIALTPAQTRLCHWSFYTRHGAFGIYQAILQRRPGWDIGTLSNIACLGPQEPRWSRIRTRRKNPAAEPDEQQIIKNNLRRT